ncbi:MAG: hypothetical protein M1816_002783 [Peltula sp. TS41687]|nr:MAG: hypothetical protein M1816_002783 [Peltula sp. TS41687]
MQLFIVTSFFLIFTSTWARPLEAPSAGLGHSGDTHRPVQLWRRADFPDPNQDNGGGGDDLGFAKLKAQAWQNIYQECLEVMWRGAPNPDAELKKRLTKAFDEICDKQASQWETLVKQQFARSNGQQLNDPNILKSVVGGSPGLRTRLHNLAATIGGIYNRGKQATSAVGGFNGFGSTAPVPQPFPL